MPKQYFNNETVDAPSVEMRSLTAVISATCLIDSVQMPLQREPESTKIIIIDDTKHSRSTTC